VERYLIKHIAPNITKRNANPKSRRNSTATGSGFKCTPSSECPYPCEYSIVILTQYSYFISVCRIVKKSLPCAAGPRAAAPSKSGPQHARFSSVLGWKSGLDLLGRKAAEREKKSLCRASGANPFPITFPSAAALGSRIPPCGLQRRQPAASFFLPRREALFAPAGLPTTPL
jgi:hypothetical protein